MLKVAIALGSAIFFGALADILMSRGMRANGEVRFRRISDIAPLLHIIITNTAVLAGIGSMTIYFCTYIAALGWVDVSVANPLTALSYVIATIYALLFVRERVNVTRALGIALITLGSVFVGLSS